MKSAASVICSLLFCHILNSQSFFQRPILSRVTRDEISFNVVSPKSIYGDVGEDNVWDSMRNDAQSEASKEPLLASFMHATILSHSSLERALAFHIANLLSSPAMISTQIQALILEVRALLSSIRKCARASLTDTINN
jgi:Serine acetyltransferase, N-terminal